MLEPETLQFEDIESWLLSGKPVVRLWVRDFDINVSAYIEWLRRLEKALGVSIAILRTSDVPGVVVQAYTGKEPELVDPLMVASKTKTPWLFCPAKGCKVRTQPGTPLGGLCYDHETRKTGVIR